MGASSFAWDEAPRFGSGESHASDNFQYRLLEVGSLVAYQSNSLNSARAAWRSSSVGIMVGVR